MSENKLPDRLYYPLPEAAEFLGCSVRDVYHYCATGMIALTVYLRDIYAEDVGLMTLDLGGELLTPDDIDAGANLMNEISLVSGIHYETEDELKFIRANYIDGFFYVGSTDCFLLEFSSDSFITLSGVTSHPFKSTDDGVYAFFHKGLNVPRERLCILGSDIVKVIEVNEISVDKKEHPKRANKKGEIIPALLKMIPEFGDVNLESESISKIASVLEAIAAAKGIELNLPDKNTWARYLGRK